jgi:hypothetical protein
MCTPYFRIRIVEVICHAAGYADHRDKAVSVVFYIRGRFIYNQHYRPVIACKKAGQEI